VTAQKKVADKYGLPLICYEAGQSLVGVGGAVGDNNLTALLEAANRNTRMGAIYTNYLSSWRAAGGRLMCLFESVSAFGQYGSWGLLEAADQTSAPKFDAVLSWNAANARPFPQLKAAAPQNGVFSVQVQGEPDASYLIQSSPDLASWQIMSDTTTGSNGLASYSINSAGSPAEFFRASPQ
jgi:hypothetical protein